MDSSNDSIATALEGYKQSFQRPNPTVASKVPVMETIRRFENISNRRYVLRLIALGLDMSPNNLAESQGFRRGAYSILALST